MNGLKEFIIKNDFEFGSKNYDDDFHTDILFYRSSCSSIKEYVGECHQNMIAFHTGFTSAFYYSKHKTKTICERILFLLQNDDDFLLSFEKVYKMACAELESCWEEKGLSPLDYYRKQYMCQQTMYKYCWPFEVLQTQYGIEYEITKLLQKNNFTKAEIADILYNNEISTENVYFQEKKELKKICDYVSSREELQEIFKNSLSHIVILLPPELRKKINKIVSKYKYLYYHGFSDRKLPNIYDYLIRVKEGLHNPIVLDEPKKQKECVADQQINRLLYCYRKLSALKSIRRLAQLKNFYFLDRFIEALADERGVPESTIRYMTPEELIEFYKTGIFDKNIENRICGMIYICENGQEKIINTADVAYYQSLLSNNKNIKKTNFAGKIACRGYAKGKVLKVIRPNNAKNITKNSIILTHEGDPDLLPIIKKAGAVVCEQGGITCHMAVIAREYGIPCLIGVGNNVIDCFKDGDMVEVDAIDGYLKRSNL